MAKKATKDTATYIVSVRRLETGEIETAAILDQKRNRVIDFKKEKPALSRFLNEDDMKESLNWCLNCYESRTRVVWEGNNGKVYMID